MQDLGKGHPTPLRWNKKNQDAGQADITDARMLLGGKRKHSGSPPDNKPADKRPRQQKELLAPSKRPNRSKAAKPGKKKARMPIPKVKDPAPKERSVQLHSAATKEKAGVRLTEREKRAKRAQRFAK